MALYEAAADIFTEDNRLVRPGERFSSDRVPGKNWLPCDEAAKAAVAERFPNGVEISAIEKPPARTLATEIPDNWRELHHLRRHAIASAIKPKFTVPDGKSSSEVADEIIATEEARRAAQH